MSFNVFVRLKLTVRCDTGRDFSEENIVSHAVSLSRLNLLERFVDIDKCYICRNQFMCKRTVIRIKRAFS